MDCVSERVYMDVFTDMRPCMHALARVHVNMSGGNHKSAELENLQACDLSNVPIRSVLLRLAETALCGSGSEKCKNFLLNPLPLHITLHPLLVYFLFLLQLLVSL